MRKLCLLLGAVFAFSSMYSQGFLKKIKQGNPVGQVLEGKPPVSTSFKDVDLSETLSPDHGANAQYISLSTLQKTEDGLYKLKPGFYETINLSYCLKAGTNGPAKGDSYGTAPVLGKMDEIVEAVIANSQDLWKGFAGGGHNPIVKRVGSLVVSQKDVQLLLWAIIARADFESMQNKTKAVALALLTPEQVVKLNGGAVKTVVNFASDKGFLEKPQFLKNIEQAEQSMRSLYQSANSTYEDFERLAILAGINPEPQPVPFGTWFKHKKGYYLRYEPQGYSRTHIKIYVPEGEEAALRMTGLIATPSDSRQRLAQTDISVEDYQKSGMN